MNLFRFAATFAAGALAMYYFDPIIGRRRRALLRDQGVAAEHDLEDFARAKSKRAADRLQGAAARTRSRLTNRPLSDQQLHDRIRSKLGRVIDHPHAVEVEVHQGHVVLSGTVSASEMEDLIDAVATMQGVESVDNQLTEAEEGAGTPPPGTEARQDARH